MSKFSFSLFIEKKFFFELHTLIKIIYIVMSKAKFVVSSINFYTKFSSRFLP